MKIHPKKLSIRKGFGFGLTSGVITTLGIIIGLNASTHSTLVIIGGILIMAIADGLSDSTAIHISEEAELKHTTKQIWESTISAFISKFLITLTFLVPILLFSLYAAIIVDVIWGLFLMIVFSIYLAKKEKLSIIKVIFEHILITVLVIISTHFLGNWVGKTFV